MLSFFPRDVLDDIWDLFESVSEVSLSTQHLDSLLEQLPLPYLLLGDFNGHNILWGCNKNITRGEIIVNFITNNGICLMNDKTYTYLHPAIGTFSSLALLFVIHLVCSSLTGLYVKINMEVVIFLV